MPWFRKGAEVHYASYFARFGKTPEEILHTMFTRPGMLFDAIVTPQTMLYAIALLGPWDFYRSWHPQGWPLACPSSGYFASTNWKVHVLRNTSFMPR